MHFRKKSKQRTTFSYTLGASTLSIVDTYKYLGIVLNEYLDYTVTADVLANSAGRALGAVINKFKCLKNMGYMTFTSLFGNCVSPILEYGSSSWGYKSFSKIESVLHRAMRFYLGVHRFAPILGVIGDIGWSSARVGQHINMVRLWNRLIEMDENRITKRIFMWDLSLAHNNWTVDIRQILRYVNLEHIYDNQSVCTISELRTLEITNCNNIWATEISNKPKLRTYIKFKNN